jgi:hypothetical protein
MGYLPTGGFLHLVTSSKFTVTAIKHVIADFCRLYGDIQPFFDDQALTRCAEEWRDEIFNWTQRYRADFALAGGLDSADEELSHIKHAGALLRAFTQCGYEGVQAASVNGILPAHTKDLIEAYPNEYLIFIAVYWLFNEQQYQRADAKLLYDHEDPPMNSRYMRAVVYYLSSGGDGSSNETCRNSDLYLIFKTMDLFGVTADYKS